MKNPSRSFSAFLIATTAMIAPHAMAQEADPADAAQSETADGGAERIVVLGEFIPEPLQETSEVAAFLTDTDLERQGDSTAAEALTRVTGLTVAEGRFVYVRGLGERYSSALLNGSPLPSPEPLQRVVPLDLFPSSILAGVAVQKTYSVEYPGEFGGGVIDLSSLNLPDTPFLELGVGFSVNTETTLQTGYTHDGGSTDVLGFDDGLRKFPVWMRLLDASGLALSDVTNQNTLNLIGQSFENAKLNLVQVNDDIPANGNVDMTGGYRWDFGDISIGTIGVLGFSNDWETRDGIRQRGRTVGDTVLAVDDVNYTSTQNKVGWDGLLGFGAEFGYHTANFTNLWIRRTTKETALAFGLSDSLNDNALFQNTGWYERELFSHQVDGTFDFGALNLDWRASHAVTTREAPYERSYVFPFDSDIQRYVYAVGGSGGASNQTDFSDLNDQVDSAGLDATYSIPFGSTRDMEISAGVAHTSQSRRSSLRSFGYRYIGNNGLPPIEVQQQRIDFLFSDFNINENGFIIEERTPAGGNNLYDAELEVTGAYAKVDVEPIQYVRIALGGRFEQGFQTVITRDRSEAPVSTIKNNEEYFLPAGTVTWNFAPDMQLKLGASKTIGRPQFRELAPQFYRDPENDRTYVGNPFLVDTEFTNADIRYEYFFGPQQYFTLGAFYKDITKPVETFIISNINSNLQSFLNAPSAELVGGEIEVKRLWDSPFDADWLATKEFLVQANYTYTDSKLQIDPSDTVATRNGGTPQAASDFFIDGAQLQGQSEHIANLQFGYEDQVAGSQATFIVTYASERIAARGGSSNPDFIQEPGVLLDFNYRKEFEQFGRPLTFKFKASNLLDENYDEYQSFDAGQIVINRYDLGRTFSFGLSTEF